MADINAYQGDAALGFGSSAGVGGPIGILDAKPVHEAIARIQQYNFLEARDRWSEANKQKDLLATEAGKLLAFDFGDLVPNDRKLINEQLEELQKMFIRDPTSVRLKMDSTGKAVNAEGVAKVQAQRTKIKALITRGNERKVGDLAVTKQIQGMTKSGDEGRRADAIAWQEKARNSSMDEDIMLYPDYAMFDFGGKMKTAFSVNKTFPTWDTKRNQIFQFSNVETDLPRGLANMGMLYITEEDTRVNTDKTIVSWNEIIKGSVDENGKYSEEALKKHPNGMSMLEMSKQVNAFVKDYNQKLVDNKIVGGQLTEVNLADGINSPQELYMMMAAGQISQSKTLDIKATDEEIKRRNAASGERDAATNAGELVHKIATATTAEAKAKAVDALGAAANSVTGEISSAATKEGTELHGTHYQNIFARPTNQKHKIRIDRPIKDENGKTVGIEQETVDAPVREAPVKIVARRTGDGPDDYVVDVTYRDKTTVPYNPAEVRRNIPQITGQEKDVIKVMESMETNKASEGEKKVVYKFTEAELRAQYKSKKRTETYEQWKAKIIK